MVKCPNCNKENRDPKKTWKYGQFMVQSYSCNACGTRFRDYSREGKSSFTLKFEKGKGFVKG